MLQEKSQLFIAQEVAVKSTLHLIKNSSFKPSEYFPWNYIIELKLNNLKKNDNTCQFKKHVLTETSVIFSYTVQNDGSWEIIIISRKC